MKKLALLLAVVLMAAPVMAGDATVTVDTSVGGQATVTIAGGAVGIGLDVNADADVDIASIDSFFDIFIDLAHDEVAGDGYAYGEGSADASNAGAEIAVAGQLALPAANFAICAGGLGGETGTPADPPASADIVLTAAGGTTVTLSENVARGGIVDKDGKMTVTGLPVTFTIGASGPACWACPEQPNGDATGDGNVNLADLFALKAAFGSSTGDANYNECADFTQDGSINLADLFALKAGFGTTTGVACP